MALGDRGETGGEGERGVPRVTSKNVGEPERSADFLEIYSVAGYSFSARISDIAPLLVIRRVRRAPLAGKHANPS